MESFAFTHEDIEQLLISLALSYGRGSFMPGGVENIAKMPEERRRDIAAVAAVFFGMDESFPHRACAFNSWRHWADDILEGISRMREPVFTFRTSGSTGIPKPCPFTPANLAEETDDLAPLFTGTKRVVSVMPMHHVFGFAFALLLPKRLGIPVLQLSPLPTAEFFHQLQNGDLVLAFPIFWRSLLRMHAAFPQAKHPGDLHGVTSAAPCPPEVIEALLGEAPDSPPRFLAGMTEIYGATEYGAVGMRRACREPYTLLPRWHRDVLAASKKTTAEEIWGIRRAEGPVSPLSDVVQWFDERHFSPLCRKDSAVQVGGVNVFPARVAALLLTHPKVKECSVRLMRPDEGVRLKAFVVPEKEAPADKERDLVKELKDWLFERLDPAATPKAIRLGETLPHTPSGKLADWDAFG